MRPPGAAEQLAKRRQKAWDLLESGKAIKEIARQLGTTERSVRRWREEAKILFTKFEYESDQMRGRLVVFHS